MGLQGKFGHGFTLIETISVVLLLAVVGVVAMSRLGDLGGFERRAFFDEVVSAVRYAQKLAVSTGCDVQVNISATGYALHQRQTDCTSGAFTRDVLNPAARSNAYQNANPNASISPAMALVFTAQSTVTGPAADPTFTLDGRQFMVYRETGLVDVL